MNTLPFRLSFPFESTERPRLKMDLHLLDFPDNFLLTDKQSVNETICWLIIMSVDAEPKVAILAVWYVDDSVVERGSAGVRQTVLSLTFFMHRMVRT